MPPGELTYAAFAFGTALLFGLMLGVIVALASDAWRRWL